MKIALDEKHFLNSDQYSYWITCLVTYTSKKTGEEKTVERRVSGSARTFSDAVTSFIENRIRTSESAEICDLKNKVEQLRKTVQRWRQVNDKF